MAKPVRRTRTSAPGPDKTKQRIRLHYVDINDLQPYPYNPRNNEAAIASVANSIKTFGFLIPVVIDSNNVLVAGHTRVEAAKTLGISEVPTVLADHLTETEINAFRVIDNKVASISSWDFDMLSGEIDKLKDSGLMLTDFGWSREEIDCLSSMAGDDCLSADGLIDIEAQERIKRTERRAPATARCVIGEFVFFIPASCYKSWADGIRALTEYDEKAITQLLKERLGMSCDD